MTHRTALTCTLALLLSTTQALPLAQISQAGVLRLATSADFAPFNSKDGTTLSGFEVDLGNLIAQTLGLKVQWTVAPFDSIFDGLNTEQYDAVIASHAITSTRLKVVDFARPHYCTGGVVLSRRGGPADHKALVNQKVGAESGSTYFAYLKKLPFQKAIQLFPTSDDAIQALAFGKVSAVVTDRFAALAAVKAYPGATLVLGEQLWKEEIGMAVRKGNTTLKAALDSALNTLLENGKYRALSLKYFKQDIRC
ncbi:ABC transporter substrate-binding protein (plasmid) [Deinococcus sp. KNUC1210]|uniref:ABC transporter substrate-binding protein n=1 Tax=Deinococcus sp. KNUC1210 TaxID=2917691 RepID=UPI001EEFBF46|nr:ABC transporter substrate-binding protein [Deinococcus sp. KNUC1210]ULH14044.1 ABC transporter substrate-binding protein [Deinococcus sp. KNUC1210]